MSEAANVILIGYRGTGKSTVAQLVARRLQRHWLDIDDLVEESAGQSIQEIFAEDGEARFRDLEEQSFAFAMEHRDRVIATGGGLILRENNRRLLSQGRVFWLTASPQTLYERIYSDPSSSERRPNLTASGGLAEIETVLGEREPLYRELSEHEVDTEGKTPDQVASQIVSLLGS